MTDAGKAAFEQYSDADDFEKEARIRYQNWAAQQPSGQFDPAEEAEDAEAAQLEKGEQHRRAWLVRGANVSNVNVLPRWLDEGFCSIQWIELDDIPAGTSRSEIAQMVKAAFPDAPPVSRGNMVGNLHRFINEISIGDVVVTVDRANVYVGVITSQPTYTGQKLVTRRRLVDWHNADAPFARSQLSSSAETDCADSSQSANSPRTSRSSPLWVALMISRSCPTPDVALAAPTSGARGRVASPCRMADGNGRVAQ